MFWVNVHVRTTFCFLFEKFECYRHVWLESTSGQAGSLLYRGRGSLKHANQRTQRSLRWQSACPFTRELLLLRTFPRTIVNHIIISEKVTTLINFPGKIGTFIVNKCNSRHGGQTLKKRTVPQESNSLQLWCFNKLTYISFYTGR